MSNDNSVFRIHNKGFTIVSNDLVNNEKLSFKAKGIMLYLLSKPDGWKVRIRDIMNHSKDGRDSVYAGLNELREEKYIILNKLRNEKGQITDHVYHVYFSPQEEKLPQNTPINAGGQLNCSPAPISDNDIKPLTEKPEVDSSPFTGKPDTENPDTEKPEVALYNNKVVNKKDINKKDYINDRPKNFKNESEEKTEIQTNPDEDDERWKDEKFEYTDRVFLSFNELQKLTQEYGERYVEDFVMRMSNYKQQYNKEYNSDFAALRNWMNKERSNNGQRTS